MANEIDAQGASGEIEPVYNFVGTKVALGPGTREENIREFYRAENDFATAILSGDLMRPRERERYETDYDRYSKEAHPDWVSFIIYDRATATAIGGVGLRHMDLTKGIAELGIIITRKDYWGGGYGTEAITLILDHGFTALGLHNVLLETYAYNERALSSYRKVGFKEIGRRREAQRIGDMRYDTVYMDILRTEFHSPFPPVVPLP